MWCRMGLGYGGDRGPCVQVGGDLSLSDVQGEVDGQHGLALPPRRVQSTWLLYLVGKLEQCWRWGYLLSHRWQDLVTQVCTVLLQQGAACIGGHQSF